MKRFLWIWIYVVFVFLPITSHAGINQWTTNGPYGGDIYTIAVSPNYAVDRTVFIGTGTGPFKSADCGANWTAAKNGIINIPATVYTFTISPNYALDGIVYAGSYGGFVFKSIDRGANWEQISTIASTDIKALAISPNYSTDHTIYAGSNGGVIKSTDGGTTWSPANTGITNNTIYALAISSNYASDNTIYAGTGGGVFKSTSGGTSWTPMNGGLSNTSIRALAISPNYPADNEVYAGTWGGGVFKSTNGGSNWTPVNNGLTYTGIQALAVSPNYATDRTLYAGVAGGGVYKSTNGGTSWAAVNNGTANAGIVALAVSPNFAVDNTTFATSTIDVLRTTSGGASWSAINTGINCVNLQPIAVSCNVADNTLYAGSNSFVSKSIDGGVTWTNSDAISYVRAIVMSPNHRIDNTVFAGLPNSVKKSVNGGATWADAITGIFYTSIYSLAISPNYTSDNTVYAGSWNGGVYKSANGGASWSPVNTGLTVSDTAPTALAVSPNYAVDRTVYAVMYGYGLYKSSNAGANWALVNAGLASSSVYTIAISPNYSVDGTVYYATGSGVLKSVNSGSSWTAVNSGLGNTDIRSLAISPNYAADGTIFAGTWGGGVFESTDGGASWTALNTGLADMNVKGLAILPNFASDKKIYAITSGGAWNYTIIPADTTPPASSITAPASGALPSGITSYAVTGTASDAGSGVSKVEVSTDGGASWHLAAGTASWSYSWPLPPSGGSRTIRSRATDNAGNVETPGAGVTLTITPYSYGPNTIGNRELPHYNWDVSTIPGGTDCTFCHTTPNRFLAADFRMGPGFCYSCHNPAGNGHALGLYSSRGQHTMFVNATAAGRKKPSYGNITAGERNNRPNSRLKDGYRVTCATCHNDMKKSDDPGRTWEYTTTSDRYKYYLQNGGWSGYGNLTPKVYRDTSLWSGPAYSRTRKSYLIDPSEYTYNEMSGFIRFKAQQPAISYVYATLYYPYLRAPMQDNALCSDCHTQNTHKGANCMNCHQAHNTSNIKGIREKVRTTNLTTIPVRFINYSKANSFADGNSTRDGICEVCHTQTKYYRRDGTGFANHSGGLNYDGKNCATCHTHSTGFAK